MIYLVWVKVCIKYPYDVARSKHSSCGVNSVVLYVWVPADLDDSSRARVVAVVMQLYT